MKFIRDLFLGGGRIDEEAKSTMGRGTAAAFGLFFEVFFLFWTLEPGVE